ncbi:catecholate siderophore receptor Fiu [Variovorax sp. J22G21]|uniref:catecholate siderophore receptor Fiu n=1 Tax=Variovorax fucosicus TaxID=3053517 RepID=UPI0025778006|nr:MULTISPECIES: catecholate siderophore receptor Fiu [unclassified Variovorax]MDM0040595.1 catecholate siderophore receptor Fiu [Variovorax sp. J22R193]MDM0061968.1 catecholate siderophore receptor Fiu [Variovorax sp. J22G21]
MAYIKSRKHAVARAVSPFGGVAAATLVALAMPAGAQTTNTLKEVQVQDSVAADYKADTSANPKFTAPLLDTPQTVQVIKEQILREQGATTLTEALRNTPGAGAFYLGENGNTSTGDAIYLRGFDTSSSIFVDGIRDLGSVSRDVFNIEQVEVVKGAASSDIGRTAPTGYINMITKKPKTEDSFYGSIGFGSADYKRGSIDWNKSLSGENGIGAAFRLNAVAEDAGVAGRDFVKNKRWGIAPSIALGLNSPTRMYFDYVHIKQNNVPDGGVPTIGLPGYTNPDPVALGARRRTFLDYASRVDSSNFYGTSSDFDNVTSDMFTARFEHDFTPNLTLRNTTRYGKTSQDYMLTSFQGGGLATTGLAPAANLGYLATPSALNPYGWTVTRNLPTNKDQENTVFVNQTNVTAKFDTGSVGHTLSAGVELMRESQRASNFYGAGYASVGTTYAPAGSWPAANLYAPNPYVSGYNRINNGTGSKGSTDTIGLYVFDTVKFNEQWSLTGGLRYDHYRTDYDATALTLATTRGVQTSTIAPTNLSLSDNLFTGKIGLVYKPVENGSIYAGYSTGAQPPGGANFTLAAAAGTTNSAARTDFLPQKAKTFEVGTKWDILNKKVSLTAAVYRTDVSNEVVQDSTTLQYYQTGKKRVQGIELGIAGAITNAWGVSAGFTTQDTKIVSGPSVLADGSGALAYTPKNAFTAWTTYQFPFGLTIGGGARYNGKLNRGTDSAVGTPAYVDAYWVFDAMASYRINKNVDIQLNIYNLTDKDYVASINKSGYRYLPGTPRSARITANFAF